MIELMTGLPDGVVGARAVGEVEAVDYETILVPAVEAALEGRQKMRLLYVLGPEFEEYETDAAWEDAKLGMHHLFDFERVAVVTDVTWMSRSIRMFGFAIPGKVKVFPYADLDAAKAWIVADD